MDPQGLIMTPLHLANYYTIYADLCHKLLITNISNDIKDIEQVILPIMEGQQTTIGIHSGVPINQVLSI